MTDSLIAELTAFGVGEAIFSITQQPIDHALLTGFHQELPRHAMFGCHFSLRSCLALYRELYGLEARKAVAKELEPTLGRRRAPFVWPSQNLGDR